MHGWLATRVLVLIRGTYTRVLLCQTYWVPEFVKEKRFRNWLENARDWAVSRNRFWGCASRVRPSRIGSRVPSAIPCVSHLLSRVPPAIHVCIPSWQLAHPNVLPFFGRTPIPMWMSDDGKEVKVIGSIEELEKLSGEKITDL